jgi:hypothetical protein
MEHLMTAIAALTFIRTALSTARRGSTVFTVVFKNTGRRFTFRIGTPDKPKDPDSPPIFVRVLSGPDNTKDFGLYLGRLDRGRWYDGKVSAGADSYKAWKCLLDRAMSPDGSYPEDRIEIWHAGSCCKCGRRLTVPESIRDGIGPVCAAGGAD